MENIINCTPHAVTMCDNEGNIYYTFPKGEIIPRLSVKTVSADPIGEIPTSVTQFGELENLPEKVEGTFLIVSQLVKNAAPERTDLLVPAEVYRDASGNIVGCKSLGR